ncbi:hypothetical protein H4219_004204 [Mycoemilia scoparia]|uniref:Uncharacterized protein n=1 Tax=Mycoemilia scoparia TaxID=417184 RepID=A0A9W8DS76_9FUNG|nr:hypothetical protein H4219_004204 [Mycoemilia scoparia]
MKYSILLCVYALVLASSAFATNNDKHIQKRDGGEDDEVIEFLTLTQENTVTLSHSDEESSSVEPAVEITTSVVVSEETKSEPKEESESESEIAIPSAKPSHNFWPFNINIHGNVLYMANIAIDRLDINVDASTRNYISQRIVKFCKENGIPQNVDIYEYIHALAQKFFADTNGQLVTATTVTVQATPSSAPLITFVTETSDVLSTFVVVATATSSRTIQAVDPSLPANTVTVTEKVEATQTVEETSTKEHEETATTTRTRTRKLVTQYITESHTVTN